MSSLARPSRNRMASPYAPAVRPAGHLSGGGERPKGQSRSTTAPYLVSWVATIPSCLGDTCPSSAQTAPVGSRQLRLGRHSVECGLVGCSRAWWNDRGNDHLSKRWPGSGTSGLRPGPAIIPITEPRLRCAHRKLRGQADPSFRLATHSNESHLTAPFFRFARSFGAIRSLH